MALRKLTEKQLAVLACVRDQEVVPYVKHLGWRSVRAHRAHGFDVTSQIASLRKRYLIKIDGFNYKHLHPDRVCYVLSKSGVAELEQHPEF